MGESLLEKTFWEEKVMKKSNFIALILGTIGVVFFALGMCMAMLPE